MLIENVNMQMESEIADINDRKIQSLFAGQLPSGANLTLDAIDAKKKSLKKGSKTEVHVGEK